MKPSVTERLASSITERTISIEDCERAQLLLLDWTGCAVGGSKGLFGDNLSNVLPFKSGDCVRIGSLPAGPVLAAFHNGCLGNMLEMDDVDKRAILHAGPTIIPAALAVGEHVNAAPNDVLKAILVGYEATIRIGRAVGAGHYAFWHNTATCGPFGAATAACSLLGCNVSELTSALGLVGTQAAGLWQTRHEADSNAKQIHAGHAAQIGVLSAFLAREGIQGPRSILDGEQGFFAAMCPGANPEDVLKDYGPEWLIHNTSLKPYPSCRHAHPAIDAIIKSRMTLKDVKTWPIIIETYDDALKFCDRPHPASMQEAMFSLQHVAAVTLLGKPPILADFSEAVINDPKIMAIRDRVELRASEFYQTPYPKHFGASVSINGQISAVKDAYGDPENPMDEKAVIKKALSMFNYHGLSAVRANELCSAAMNFMTLGSIKHYTRHLP